MKKALLAGVAALSVLMVMRPAPAQMLVRQLPAEMVDQNWRTCDGDPINEDDNDPRTVYAPDNGAECEVRGWAIHLGDTGYGAPGEGNCEFDKIEQIAPMAFRIHANCHVHWSQGNERGTHYRTENFDLEIIDGHLIKTNLGEG
jgi:hypothetical protein